MQDLPTSLAAIAADYRQGEVAAFDAKHVRRWISQFHSDVREPMLAELVHVFGKTYFKRRAVESFLSTVLKSKKMAGDDYCAFWAATKFLDIQRGGNSQKEMLDLFSRLLKKECGLGVDECGQDPERFVYLDDVLFTGNRIKNDLEAWIEGDAPQSADVYVVAIGLHSGGKYYANGRITASANAARKKINLQWWRAVEIEDRKSETNVSDVLRPTEISPDELTQAYVKRMKYAPVLRKPGSVGAQKFFSSEEGRHLLEQEFLKAGCRIRSICPHLGVYQRPLGNMVLDTLGFGSMIVTFRNCPNNAPLALWVGDASGRIESYRRCLALGAHCALAGPGGQGCDGAARIDLHAVNEGG